MSGDLGTLEANLHRLSHSELNLTALRNVCDALPFLSEYRIVIVEGLLSAFNRGGNAKKPARSTRSRTSVSTNKLEVWAGLSQYVGEFMPDTTMLIFEDTSITKGNPLFEQLVHLATVKDLAPLSGEGLGKWIIAQVQHKGSQINNRAIQLLSGLVGSNLWALENELEKLALYAGDRPIEESDVLLLVSQAKDANIFAAVDALLEKRSSTAMQIFHSIRTDGFEMPYIISMIARQLRQVVLARDLLDRGTPPATISNLLNISHQFILRKTLDQARSHSLNGLHWLYARLLATDIAIKRGHMGQDIALDILIGDSGKLFYRMNRPHPSRP